MLGMLALILVALPPAALADTFYISSISGSDLNDGTSPSQAWKTFQPSCGFASPTGGLNLVLTDVGPTSVGSSGQCDHTWDSVTCSVSGQICQVSFGGDDFINVFPTFSGSTERYELQNLGLLGTQGPAALDGLIRSSLGRESFLNGVTGRLEEGTLISATNGRVNVLGGEYQAINSVSPLFKIMDSGSAIHFNSSRVFDSVLSHAILASDATEVVVSDSHFQNISAYEPGSAVYTDYGAVRVVDSFFTSHRFLNSEGSPPYRAAAVVARFSSEALFRGNTFQQIDLTNSVEFSSALRIEGATVANLTDNMFEFNIAYACADLQVYAEVGSLLRNTFRNTELLGNGDSQSSLPTGASSCVEFGGEYESFIEENVWDLASIQFTNFVPGVPSVNQYTRVNGEALYPRWAKGLQLRSANVRMRSNKWTTEGPTFAFLSLPFAGLMTYSCKLSLYEDAGTPGRTHFAGWIDTKSVVHFHTTVLTEMIGLTPELYADEYAHFYLNSYALAISAVASATEIGASALAGGVVFEGGSVVIGGLSVPFMIGSAMHDYVGETVPDPYMLFNGTELLLQTQPGGYEPQVLLVRSLAPLIFEGPGAQLRIESGYLLAPRPATPYVFTLENPTTIVGDVYVNGEGALRVVDLKIVGNLYVPSSQAILSIGVSQFRNMRHGLVVEGNAEVTPPIRLEPNGITYLLGGFEPTGQYGDTIFLTNITGTSDAHLFSAEEEYGPFKVQPDSSDPKNLKVTLGSVIGQSFYSPDGNGIIFRWPLPVRDWNIVNVAPDCQGLLDPAENTLVLGDAASLSCRWINAYEILLTSSRIPLELDPILLSDPPFVRVNPFFTLDDLMLEVDVAIAPLPSPVMGPNDVVLDARGSMYLSGPSPSYAWSIYDTSASSSSALSTFLAAQTSPLISVPFNLLEELSVYIIQVQVQTNFQGTAEALVKFVVNSTCSTTALPLRIVASGDVMVAYDGLPLELMAEFDVPEGCPALGEMQIEWVAGVPFDHPNANIFTGPVFMGYFTANNETGGTGPLFYEEEFDVFVRASALEGSVPASYGYSETSLRLKLMPSPVQVYPRHRSEWFSNEYSWNFDFDNAANTDLRVRYNALELISCPVNGVEFFPPMHFPDIPPYQNAQNPEKKKKKRGVSSLEDGIYRCPRAEFQIDDPLQYRTFDVLIDHETGSSSFVVYVGGESYFDPGKYTFVVHYTLEDYQTDSVMFEGTHTFSVVSILEAAPETEPFYGITIVPLVESIETAFSSNAHRLLFEARTAGDAASCPPTQCVFEWYFPNEEVELALELRSHPTIAIPRESIAPFSQITLGVKISEATEQKRDFHGIHQQQNTRRSTKAVHSAFAERTISIASGPAGGNFTVSPAQGEASSTQFAFENSKWSSMASHVKYLYSVADESGTEVPLIGAGTFASGFEGQIPIFCPNVTCDLTVISRVYDAVFAIVTRTVTVTVSPPAPEKTFNDEEFFNATIAQFETSLSIVDLPDIIYWSNLVAFHLSTIDFHENHTQFEHLVDKFGDVCYRLLSNLGNEESIVHSHLMSQFARSISRTRLINSRLVNDLVLLIARTLETLPQTGLGPGASELGGVTLGNLLESITAVISIVSTNPEIYTSEYRIEDISDSLTQLLFTSVFAGEPRVMYNSSRLAFSLQQYTIDLNAPSTISINSGTSTTVEFDTRQTGFLDGILGPNGELGVAHTVFLDGGFLSRLPADAPFKEVSRLSFRPYFLGPSKKRSALAQSQTKTTFVVTQLLIEKKPACGQWNTETEQWDTDTCSTRVGGSGDVNCDCNTEGTQSDLTLIFGAVTANPIEEPGLNRNKKGGISKSGIAAAIIVPLIFLIVAAIVLVNLFVPKMACGPFKRYHDNKNGMNAVKMAAVSK